ncbi:uncharacterized protein [Rhodnius prolixus]|uniref:uncharacterized protein n=1 Tax=Rhodnius prolixus TaxID=13249 RepID=UPI003D18A177
MKSMLCLLACVAYVSATGLLHGVVHDDGQWRPWLDGSVHGASPGLATAALGAASVGHGAGHVLGAAGLVGGVGHLGGAGLLGGVGHLGGAGLLGGVGHLGGVGLLGVGHLGAGHLLHKRSLGLGVLGHGVLGHGVYGHGVVNPNALNVPLDTVHVAAAKNAQLVQQAAEGARNVLGHGVPAALPADTHAVAVGKVAHAVAHDTELATHSALVGAHGGWAGLGGWGGHGGWGGLGGWGGHGVGAWGGYGAGWGGHGAHWGGHGW